VQKIVPFVKTKPLDGVFSSLTLFGYMFLLFLFPLLSILEFLTTIDIVWNRCKPRHDISKYCKVSTLEPWMCCYQKPNETSRCFNLCKWNNSSCVHGRDHPSLFKCKVMFGWILPQLHSHLNIYGQCYVVKWTYKIYLLMLDWLVFGPFVMM